MAITNLLFKQDAESGLSFRLNKDFKFLLKRIALPEGIAIYLLENKTKNERLIIPRELFDRFRSTFIQYQIERQRSEGAEHELEKRVYFKDHEVFRFRPGVGDASYIIIQDSIKLQGSTGFLTVPLEAFDGLAKLFYQPSLRHTNDLFERLVRYHKLFQFSFTEGSESITSQLSLRRDVLSQVDEYVPLMRSKGSDRRLDMDLEREGLLALESTAGLDGAGKKEVAGKFKSKLGQKDSDKSYTVDYATLFQSGPSTDAERLPKTADDQTKRGAIASSKTFPLPVNASDIKSLTQGPFPCELTMEEATHLRENFLLDRQAEIFLGLEIIDAIFKTQGKLKTFRFPLYYMKVTIEESGRLILVHPAKRHELYLNHLALAALVESFAPENAAGTDPVEQFFQTLTSQKIEIQGRLSDLSIFKQLPIADEVFHRTRDILLGLPGENGKGGILAGLKLIGIECDLDSVALYKASTLASPVAIAREQDIDRIQEVADDYPERFYRSLLGQFLTPELKRASTESKKFCDTLYTPGALPQSTLELFNKLNHHDIVLLEGPPGTGKTFAIMNLLIHCVNTGQKLLVVSDQKAAIHALDEKLQEFLLGNDLQSAAAKSKLSLYRQAIKVVDRLPEGQLSLSQWITTLSQCLALDNSREPSPEIGEDELEKSVLEIDASMQKILKGFQERMDQQLSSEQHRRMVAAKHMHPTTQDDIADFIAYLDFTGAGRHEKKTASQKYQANSQHVKEFLVDRVTLGQEALVPCYPYFAIDAKGLSGNRQRMVDALDLVDRLLKQKPRQASVLQSILAKYEHSPITRLIQEQWHNAFPSRESAVLRLCRKLWSYVRYPNRLIWQQLRDVLDHQRSLLGTLDKLEDGDRVARQLDGMHEALHPAKKSSPSLALEASIFTQVALQNEDHSLQGLLIELRNLQDSRDLAIKDLFLTRMSRIVQAGRAKDHKSPTSSWTSIETLLEGLKECSSIDHGVGVTLLQDLQQVLLQSFPVWVCRKQAVSFLFPSKERLFDLVIIDEAGQCRVDDAIPLLYRAKKIMVVGDDKQTVLDKNSTVDDFLFGAFNLEDHLRQTQARGMKGGGSHIFGLVKSIKQAEVMLDEHFRCPPDIIQYSNQYVYDSNLKIMQWNHRDLPRSVVVDYSEKNAGVNNKATSGKFKDIEINVVDRYFDYVAATIKSLEKELGRTINLETEVALCYFLLKNEPYVKEKKAQFLQKMNRGKDVLDGAGAALQGKERNFIFYLWDINRGNIRAFRQGDDPDKRKGELNVLMSRPKMRAFHYLHPEFDSLKHETATITDYLWRVFHSQKEKKAVEVYVPRKKRPGAEFRPWQRSSGELMRSILRQVLEKKFSDRFDGLLDRAQLSVVVGNPKRKVDLMLLGADARSPSIAIVDLATFEYDKKSAGAVVDYYFQLKRAVPPVDPYFVFLHELADERSESFRLLLQRLEQLLAAE